MKFGIALEIVRVMQVFLQVSPLYEMLLHVESKFLQIK
jgi:hypothetical protein